MSYFLGVDTGGTYTDAVIVEQEADRVISFAKSLTTRSDLSLGIGRAVNKALADAQIKANEISMVSLSTTLATNALVEGQGGRVALIFIGFDAADLERAGLDQALGGDPVIVLPGGHSSAGVEIEELDLFALEKSIQEVGSDVMGFAVAAHFATRNPSHELSTRNFIRNKFGVPVTCSHELSSNLNGPKRALTAVLNARLIGMIDRLVCACEAHLVSCGIDAPLMIVRGDGALISSEMARERPIETILSGPAASIVGASWLTGVKNALVSDIGGTTTDIALLRNGLPEIDPDGALVGGYRTMVEAVAMRTTGLGGDSEVKIITDGLKDGIVLGPRRLIPVSLLAIDFPDLVHSVLDRALETEVVGEFDGRFVIPTGLPPVGLSNRELDLLNRITTAMPFAKAVTSRLEVSAMERLISRGLVMISGVTPSDASHILGRQDDWDSGAAEKSVRLLGRRRTGKGRRFSDSSINFSQKIIDQLTSQTVDCLLEAAFAEDPFFSNQSCAGLSRHPLVVAGLNSHQGIVNLKAALGVPVVGLGASAPSYYVDVGERLGCKMILPTHSSVANAIGAVVGQISQRVTGLISSPSEGLFIAHMPKGLENFSCYDDAFTAMTDSLQLEALTRAQLAGAHSPILKFDQEIKEAEIEGRSMFIEATLTVTASGRPRVASLSRL